VFRNEVTTGLAVTPDRSEWEQSGTGFRSADGTAAPALTIASNADHRWGPGPWRQVDWWNEVTPATSSVRFQPHGPRRLMAMAAGVWLLLLCIGWVAGWLEEREK
jgi:hypothetical protein